MTDLATIADSYISLWNERAPAQRRALLTRHWTADASYVDPLMRSDGHDGIDALVAGVQQRFPDYSFRLIGAASGHGDYVRFRWSLGPSGESSPIEGSDVAELKDGRIHRIIGFLDKVPEAA
ncbi:nuclear transport factor 2 family protein [Bradyrhizobium sp. HKCCYLS20291]|uniref:nuclear transport factor 2 family protein n=1 Tax=Bradyrhizobium sp. HKCCYLS20291 TaxID=3420766 RepID=UPI003EBF696D